MPLYGGDSLLGLTLTMGNDFIKEVLAFIINFILIFVYALVAQLIFVGGIPSIEQIYMAILTALLPALTFALGNRGLKPYLGLEPVTPKPLIKEEEEE